MSFDPCNVATPELTRALAAVPPSNHGPYRLRPCRARLKSGEVVERLLCTEDSRGFRAGNWVHPDDLDVVEESPLRLPARFATLLYEAGESGMGYLLFTARFRSRVEIVFVTGSAVVDFPDYPAGLTGADVVEVLPHVGRERTIAGDYRGSAEFRDCFYIPYGRQPPSERVR